MGVAKYTPGPWSREWIAGALRHIVRNVDREAFGCDDLPDDANTPTYWGTTDVDLIAAAPDAVPIMEKIVAHFVHDHELKVMAREWLKKAKVRA